jgi:redox-sensitive bicupin YhaK (pirin superfamily)
VLANISGDKQMTTQLFRSIEEVIEGQQTSDGDGVKLTRVIGGGNLNRFDPFLMLDEFGSHEAADYIGGFPSHPHRGFETVTYMLNGSMEHRDHMNNVGKLDPGDVQWMNAGSGVIHSEMPRQEEGLMRGFQLWLNLPSAEKMKPATYQDLKSDSIPVYAIDGVKIKAIAGELVSNGVQLKGAVFGLTTDPAYLDIEFKASSSLTLEVPAGYTALVYVYEGEVALTDSDSLLGKGLLARLNKEGLLALNARHDSRVLVMTGKPINEPIVQHGPFVMNKIEEIHQAVRDYNRGCLV